jgi:uncharacterized protein (DUF4415 family)
MTKFKGDTPDDENPEWTKERFQRAVRLKDLPPNIKRVIENVIADRKRGPQKAPTKVPISIRLSSDVAAGLRATGPGWQNRADEALRSWLKTEQAVTK